MIVNLVWAQARDGAIGRDNSIPWRVPEDMARFKELTVGHPVIMGRKTWDSLPPKFRPLPGRTNIVVTRDATWSDAGATVAHSLDDALATVDDDQVSIIGGAEIYRAAMPLATRLSVTEIDLDVADADAFAPTITDDWIADGVDGPHVSTSGVGYRFLDYRRRD